MSELAPTAGPPDRRFAQDRYRAGEMVSDKYRLVRPIGAGGMGVVWVAHNVVLDVHVALKLIDMTEVQSPRTVGDRVVQEARTAAKLGNPAICRVYDFGETAQGDPFIVSELLHGETLGDFMGARVRPSAVEAVRLLLPIADGLSVAHAKGIVHRDVKPENIFLSRDEVGRLQPKLLDFGIARFVARERQITIDGTLLGTPDYMSPEQARGETDLDHRTDVWSFCVVLYQLMVGRPPFDRDNYNALLWAIVHEEPPSIMDHGTGDPALWEVLSRGLRKEKEERWGSLRTLGEALAYWLYINDCHEDICGTSLVKAWLEGSGFDPGDGHANVPSKSGPRPWAMLQLEAPGSGVLATLPAPGRPRAERRALVFALEKVRLWRSRWLPLSGVAVVATALLGWWQSERHSLSPSADEPLVAAPRLSPATPARQVQLRQSAVAASNSAEQGPEQVDPAPSAAGPRPQIPRWHRHPSRRPQRKKLDPETYDLGF